MKYPFHKDAQPSTFENARRLKTISTDAEIKLWNALRGGKLDGFKFRRQHPFGNFVHDFYCHEKKLCIEVDGLIHELKENMEYDRARTEAINDAGITVIRFSNKQVMTNIAVVRAEIRKRLNGTPGEKETQ